MATKRLIDANALTDKCRQICADEWNKRAAPCSWSDAYEGFIEDIEAAPTVDAMEVVRCRDCKHCDPENLHCDHPMGTNLTLHRKPNDFCSYGERRRNNHEKTD